MKLRLMINMINISVKNSQNVAKFRVCKTHWCYQKAKYCNIKTEHPRCSSILASEIIIMVFTWHDY